MKLLLESRMLVINHVDELHDRVRNRMKIRGKFSLQFFHPQFDDWVLLDEESKEELHDFGKIRIIYDPVDVELPSTSQLDQSRSDYFTVYESTSPAPVFSTLQTPHPPVSNTTISPDDNNVTSDGQVESTPVTNETPKCSSDYELPDIPQSYVETIRDKDFVCDHKIRNRITDVLFQDMRSRYGKYPKPANYRAAAAKLIQVFPQLRDRSSTRGCYYMTWVYKLQNKFKEDRRKPKPNNMSVPYTLEEKMYLVDLVTKYTKIHCKKTDKLTVAEKDAEWDALTDEFNSSAISSERTTESLRVLWKNMKAKAKKDKEKLTQGCTETEEGSISFPSDSLNGRIEAACLGQVEGLSNPSDQDILTSQDGEEPSCTLNPKPTGSPQQGYDTATPRKRRRKSSESSTEYRKRLVLEQALKNLEDRKIVRAKETEEINARIAWMREKHNLKMRMYRAELQLRQSMPY